MKSVSALAFLGVLVFTVFCATTPTNAAGPLPDVFLSVLGQLKEKTKVDILLPTELPRPFNDAKHANAEASADKYAISLYYELNAGDAGFAASFAAINKASLLSAGKRYVRKVRLANGVTGFFRAVSCGGSCAPAKLWWKEGLVLYSVQLKLPSTLRDHHERSQLGYPRRPPLVAACNDCKIAVTLRTPIVVSKRANAC